MGMFRRGGPEPPPEGAPKGIAPGFSTVFMDPVELDRFCRANGVAANDEYQRRRFLECVVPSKRLLVLPHGASPEVTAHGEYHTHGFVHDDNGKGWKKAPNVFARPGEPYDWSSVFGPKPQTATTQNIFRGGR